MKTLYTIPETQSEIGQGKTKVYELISKGHLEAVKAGGRTLITGQSIAAYADSLPRVAAA